MHSEQSGTPYCTFCRINVAVTSSFDDAFANAIDDDEINIEELTVVDQVEKRSQAREFLVSTC